MIKKQATVLVDIPLSGRIKQTKSPEDFMASIGSPSQKLKKMSQFLNNKSVNSVTMVSRNGDKSYRQDFDKANKMAAYQNLVTDESIDILNELEITPRNHRRLQTLESFQKTAKVPFKYSNMDMIGKRTHMMSPREQKIAKIYDRQVALGKIVPHSPDSTMITLKQQHFSEHLPSLKPGGMKSRVLNQTMCDHTQRTSRVSHGDKSKMAATLADGKFFHMSPRDSIGVRSPVVRASTKLTRGGAEEPRDGRDGVLSSPQKIPFTILSSEIDQQSFMKSKQYHRDAISIGRPNKATTYDAVEESRRLQISQMYCDASRLESQLQERVTERVVKEIKQTKKLLDLPDLLTLSYAAGDDTPWPHMPKSMTGTTDAQTVDSQEKTRTNFEFADDSNASILNVDQGRTAGAQNLLRSQCSSMSVSKDGELVNVTEAGSGEDTPEVESIRKIPPLSPSRQIVIEEPFPIDDCKTNSVSKSLDIGSFLKKRLKKMNQRQVILKTPKPHKLFKAIVEKQTDSDGEQSESTVPILDERSPSKVDVRNYLSQEGLARYEELKLKRNQQKVSKAELLLRIERAPQILRKKQEEEEKKKREEALQKKDKLKAGLLGQLGSQFKSLVAQSVDMQQSVEEDPLKAHRKLVGVQFQIEFKRKMLEAIDVKKSQIEDPEQAKKLLEKLASQQNVEKNVKESLANVTPATALFIANIIEEVETKSEKLTAKRRIASELQSLIFEKNMLVRALRDAEKRGLKALGRMKSNLPPLPLEERSIDVPPALTPTIAKFQRAVNSLKPKRASLVDAVYKLLLREEAAARRRKQKNKWQRLTRKHLLGKKNRLDLPYIIKIVSMQDQLAKMFRGECLGNYSGLGFNLWANDFLAEKAAHLRRYKLPVGGSLQFNLAQAGLMNYNFLFDDKLSRLTFYEHAKAAPVVEHQDLMVNVHNKYKESCRKSGQLAVPVFARVDKNNLFLSQIKLSQKMAESLTNYFESVKDIPTRKIESFYVDDCGMEDACLASLLRGLRLQGPHLKQLIYSNNVSIGSESISEIIEMAEQLDEINIHNPKKEVSFEDLNDLMEALIYDSLGLFKLKLSKINLAEAELMNKICSFTANAQFLLTLDLSWARLSSKLLLVLSTTLVEVVKTTSLRNLNVSYNSLIQDKDHADYEATEDFIDNMCEFISESQNLTHLDFSAMNLSRDNSFDLGMACQRSNSLIAVHFSDNNIRCELDWTEELLDIFGLNAQKVFADNTAGTQMTVNMRTRNANFMRETVVNAVRAQQNKSLANQIASFVDPVRYQKRVIQTKQSQTLKARRIMNQSSALAGIGRNESSLVDEFVLSRKINQPELVFNQDAAKDLYFENGASERWIFQQGSGGMTGCSICHKHKFTVIFYEQEEHDLANADLIEVTNSKIIEEVRDSLCITFKEEKEMAPIICGSVVNGQFQRKLRMLRGDMFAMLSVCQSMSYVSSAKQSRVIRVGICEMLNRTQNIMSADETIPYFRGWQDDLIIDKCLNNQAMEVTTVNMPDIWLARQQVRLKKANERQKKLVNLHNELDVKSDSTCSTFVYAAHLPPGLHQFLIYCPKTKRLFCKDVFVDVSSAHFYPEYPRMKPDTKPKKTAANVWRKWREDSEMDAKFAVSADMCEVSYQSELFLKNELDREHCKTFIEENFDKLKMIQIENLAMSFNTSSYPEVCFDVFLKYIQSCQSFAEKSRLTKQAIELAFIRSTRNDGVKGLRGTLCRGEFYECFLRCAFAWAGQPKVLAEHLDEFAQIYVDTFIERSQVLPIRRMIRQSVALNQLLYDNLDGLQKLYRERMDGNKGFTYRSARNLLNTAASSLEGTDLCPDMHLDFVYCQMTNLKDLECHKRYHSLQFVELLEMVTRVAHRYWNMRKDQKDARTEEDVSPYPENIAEEVEYVLERLWRYRLRGKIRPSKEELKAKKNRKKKRNASEQEEFPYFVPLDLEEDSDGG